MNEGSGFTDAKESHSWRFFEINVEVKGCSLFEGWVESEGEDDRFASRGTRHMESSGSPYILDISGEQGGENIYPAQIPVMTGGSQRNSSSLIPLW